MNKTIANIRVFLCFGLFLFAMQACNKEDKANHQNSTQIETATQSMPSNFCCTVTCKHGVCKSYGEICSCTCSILGHPKCSSSQAINAMSDVMFDGREHVVLNDNFIADTQAEQQLLLSFNKSYADEVANKLSELITLVNEYGLQLNNREALLQYYTILEYIEERESSFTDSELTQMVNL